MKFRWFLGFMLAVLLLLVLTITVLAQEETPPPYAGLKNPFPWGDVSVQETGKKVYQQFCMGCHGINGGNIATADFSKSDFPRSLEAKSDYYFWRVSEGKADKGMLSFKALLSQEQRWQVLTYLHSLGTMVSAEVTPLPTQPPVEAVAGTLWLTAPKQAQSGKTLTISVALQDKTGQPIKNAPVKFFLKVQFFTVNLMEIGEAVTDDSGNAVFHYLPWLTGDIEVVAHYGTLEAATSLSLSEAEAAFYHTEAGIRLPALGPEVFAGPKSALDLGEKHSAPMTAFRLPGGVLSWLLFLVLAVFLVWGTYFRTFYLLSHIPPRDLPIAGNNIKLVPLLGMAIVLTIGIILALVLLTGPYSHLHLPR